MAVICSRDLFFVWFKHPEKFPKNYIAIPGSWDELDGHLYNIRKFAGSRRVVLDIHCHGEEQGLYLREEIGDTVKVDRASFGFVLSRVLTVLGPNVVVLCEACYPGRAYKNTIRGAVSRHPADNIGDFSGVPSFPVYGIGDASQNVSNYVYLQYRHGFRTHFVDLREYDPMGKNRPLSQREPEDKDGLNPTAHLIWRNWQTIVGLL